MSEFEDYILSKHFMNGSASDDLDIRTHFSIDNISSDGTILEG